MKRIKVDKYKCIGCGACTAIAGSVFRFNDEGYAEANSDSDNMNENLKEDCIDALEGCPVDAIYTEEEK